MRIRRLLGTAAAGLVAATGAYAYWTPSGAQGSATAAAASVQPLRVDSVTFSSTLRPNGPSRPVVIRVSNPNAFALRVVGATSASVVSDVAGCGGPSAPTGVTMDLADVRGTVAAQSSRTFTASASMASSSASACQGARFDAALELEARQ